MKKSILLTSLLALAACGGGSGGGTSGGIINPTPGEIVRPEYDGSVSADIVDSNKKILSMDSSVLDETARTAYLKEQFGEDGYNEYLAELRGENSETEVSTQSLTNRAGTSRKNGNSDKNICKSEHDCNNKIFENMKTVLNDLDNLDTMDEKDVKNALIAAGFKDEIPGTWDDIKAWIRGNATEIINQGEEVLNNPDKGKATEFKLNNAEFKILTTTIVDQENDQPGQADKMTLKIDEGTGEVIGIKVEPKTTQSAQENPAILFKEEGIARKEGTNEFDFNSDRTSGELIMKSYAQELGLRYSDFGVLVAKDGATYTSDEGEVRKMDGYNLPFVGGYEAKHIAAADIRSNEDLATEIKFEGIAKGTVEAPNESGKPALAIEDNNAYLAFSRENGSETLSANFDNWYKVDISKTPEGEYGFKYNADGKTIDEHYQFKHKPSFIKGSVPNEQWYFDTAYYGDNKTPEEAVALFQYQQQIGQDKDNGNINVFIGFGGKKAE